MCGLAGVHLRDRDAPVDVAALRAMLSTLRHRGPDGDGLHVEPALGLAFARLAIIDPAGGAQPFHEGRSVIVFNGEIYNFRELRAELESGGRRFATRSDTEVLIQALDEWGEAALPRLNGIFAFAHWDAAARELLLARDRSGVKPLYLRFDRGDLWFASEAKALLTRPEFRLAIDPAGYVGGGAAGALLEPTPFAGVQQLAAGCLLRVCEGRASGRRWWTYEPSESDSWNGDERALVERTRELLDAAVERQLVSDVPVAASLSGGIDSAAVVASMVRAGRADVSAWTVEFEGDSSGDVRHARLAGEALGVPYHGVPCAFDASTPALYPAVAWFAEGEFDLGFVARYRLALAVRRAGAKVLLTGQGIDEILTGYYPAYQQFRRLALVRRMKSELLPSYRGLPPFGVGAIDAVGAHVATDPLTGIASRPWPALCAARLRDDHRRLSSGMLRFEDRMGMAAGVEVRVPLLDDELVEHFASFAEPARARLFDGKRVLREAVRGRLPAEIADRPKVGFNVSAPPLTSLVPPHSLLAELTEDAAVRRYGYFDPGLCAASRKRRDFEQLDHVLVIHLLHELFIEGRGAGFAGGNSPDSAVLDSPATAFPV